jgi:PhzF family phenazine biosynthesis protein
MKIAIFQLDAFTNQVFKGNPAAVCPLDEWLTDGMLQNIAAENNLSETAFFIKEKEGFHIRWFTPVTEVSLCGHATLAAAAVIYRKLGFKGDQIEFNSRSGILKVKRDADKYVLDFPADVPNQIEKDPEILDAMGLEPGEWYKGNEDYMLVYRSEGEVSSLSPDFSKLKKITQRGVIATAQGSQTDFISRFFAPAAGINEDPATGSSHTTLTPFWAKRLNKTKLTSLQISPRGGIFSCLDKGERVEISGRVAFYLQGLIEV